MNAKQKRLEMKKQAARKTYGKHANSYKEEKQKALKLQRKRRIAASPPPMKDKEEHKRRMAFKKERRASMSPGFIEMPSGRVQMTYNHNLTRHLANRIDPVRAAEMAHDDTIRSLPRRRLVKNYRIRPSKSDDPAYRKVV